MPAKVVSFVNMKGGVAKTTLTVNIADTLASRHGLRVLIIDLDPQFNATQSLIAAEDYAKLRQEGADTIKDIFKLSETTVDAVDGVCTKATKPLNAIAPHNIKENLDIILGDLNLHQIDTPSGQGVERRLFRYIEDSDSRNKYDYILIDTPPTPSTWMAAAIIASDAYVVPVKPEPLSRVGIDMLKGVLRRIGENQGVRPKNLGVVLTITESTTIVYRETIDALDADPHWKGKRFEGTLPKRTGIARAQGEQKHILEAGDSETKLAIAKIAKEFIERCQ